MGTWAGEGGNLTDSSYTKPQSTTTSLLCCYRPPNMLKSRSTTRRPILVHVSLRGAYYPCTSSLNMLLRDSTLLAASAERTGRFSASASRHTAHGNSLKASVASLRPAKLIRGDVDDLADQPRDSRDATPSRRQSRAARGALRCLLMFPSPSSGRAAGHMEFLRGR